MYSSCYSCHILMKPECSRQIKSAQTSNFMKLRPLTAALFHADGLTDRHDEAIRRFSKVCERA